MALLSLALPVAGRLQPILLVVGLAGASLFFGDAMITPAISVLSAVEGLKIAIPTIAPYVVPLAAVILVGLFSIQRRGSGTVGYLFGPVMAAWFATLALSGLFHLLGHPRVLMALDPRYAFAYVGHAGGVTSFAVLGSVFLALTGGEALYADMGHFGRGPIRLDWFVLVLPALVLNYLGQGASVLADPASAENPFFLLFPGWLLVPALLLTTAATIIASQAVLSGAFALVQQAIQLGAVPRLDVQQTSEESAGQVYVPQINWLLAAIVLGLVFGFRSSDGLANAYGIAVAGDMLATTLLVTTVAIGLWKWPGGLVFPVAGLILLLDIVFVSANVHKIPAGGWFPLLVGAITLTLMLVWRKGRQVALARRDENAKTLEVFLAGLAQPEAPIRMRGTAVYLTKQAEMVPAALAPGRDGVRPRTGFVFHRARNTRTLGPARPATLAGGAIRLHDPQRRFGVRLFQDPARICGRARNQDRALNGVGDGSRARRILGAARLLLVWAAGLIAPAAHQTHAAEAANVVTLTMRTPHAGFNRMVVQVTVCAPGTQRCTTIDDVMVDTGSTGLRLEASVVPSWLRLPAVLGPKRKPLAECLHFVADDAWGPLVRVDLKIGGRSAAGLPIQIYEDGAALQPMSCPRSMVRPTSNGTLGIGPHLTDCQGECRQAQAHPTYYECEKVHCDAIEGSVAEPYRLPNPVAVLDRDENGAVFDLPDVAGAGARESVGTLAFGVGSDDVDRLHAAAIVTLDGRGRFTTLYAGQSFPDSSIDSGTGTLIVPDDTLPRCPTMPWALCVAPAVTREAVMVGRDGGRTVLPFRVGDYRRIRQRSFGASAEIAVAAGPQSGAFVWGAPLFLGRHISIVLEGRTVPGAAGLKGPLYAIESRSSRASP